ncbi:MAG: PolC-type DNA polymerase III [Fusobacteriaceae bacterium]|nr:PolC-type DNA polymerase III [Fusobacteriaceae bacterium]
MGREVRIAPEEVRLQKLGISNLKIREIIYNERHKRLNLKCLISSVAELTELDILENSIKESFGEKIKLAVNVELSAEEITKDDLKVIVERAIRKVKEKNAISRSFLYIYRVIVEDNIIKIELNNKLSADVLKESHIDRALKKMLNDTGISGFNIEFTVGDFSKTIESIAAQKDELFIKLHKKNESDIKENIKNKEGNTQDKKNDSQTKDKGNIQTFYNKNKGLKGTVITISEFEELMENETCVIEGQIFAIEIRDIRNEKILITLRITDNKNSATLKSFIDKGKSFDVKEGDYIKVAGKKQIDRFANNEEILMFNAIEKLEKSDKLKIDSSAEKMVELHTHTKMSEMVGVNDVQEIIDRAISYGHKAVAITDYSVVHAFPFAYKAAKGKEIKVILGCEMCMVDDTKPMIKNPKNIEIEEETYVVFDLETTGLNAHRNEIIEIGAIKLKGTRIVDRYSTFVKPEGRIPKKIQELTGISELDVSNAKTIEEILPEFLEFAGDATLVAHNAAFDMSFIVRDAKRILNKKIENSVIDTLQMAKDLYPTLKNYGLKTVTKFLGVALESHHRAVDDSQATANMFIVFLEKYLENNIKLLSEINGAFKINVQRQETKNVMILVKDLVGLKNIYKIVSDAHLINFGEKRARVTKTQLEKNREGLIIGSSMSYHFKNSGEVIEEYLAFNFENLETKIDFYDYIELLPKAAYNEVFDEEATGRIKDYDDIETMNRYIYDLAKKKQKLITASSNVHYLNPEDSKIRSILLYGSGTVFRENQYKKDNGFYFRTTEELLNEFQYLGPQSAYEVVITNTNSVAEGIDKIKPIPDGFYPPKIDNAENIVREMTYEKAYRLYGNPLPKIVEQRIERELKSIIGNGFSVLYLSAQKLVKKSLDNGYLVGSRGSVGSSIVAFMMDITEVNALYPHYLCEVESCKYSEFIEREGAGVDLDPKNCPKCGAPLKRDGYSIPFEVFMGFDGDKVPDIDLNFSGEYQGEIHRYCEELFGKENVFKAGTISTLAEKNAAGYVMKYYEEHEIKINSAEIIRLAKMCEGAKKTTGQHPGGMIIVPQGHTIHEFCPVQKPANDINNDSITTHFDYHVMDEQLVKLDILGHDDPTTIKLLQEYTGVNVYDIPLGDPETLKIFSSTESLGVTPEQIGSVVGTYGVPEFGTSFVRQMLIDTMPTTFAELVRISGLSHGTDVWLNNAQEFVRSGTCTLSEVISVRDDIMNYLIDQGIDKGTSFKIMEFVRKGQPSKNLEGWEKYSQLMKEHKVKDWYIESCRRIKYMFPKGHAVAYVMMAMRIAYFKVHYPLEFYAAYFSRKYDFFNYELMYDISKVKNRLDELSKEVKLDVKQKGEISLCEIIIEMKARGIEFLPIDIYASEGVKFTVENGKIRIPLVGFAGLGQAVVDNILAERVQGKFTSFEDLKRRTKASQTIIDKFKEYNAIEALSDTNQISLF